jgi:alkylhydroperoxidase family enzyme
MTAATKPRLAPVDVETAREPLATIFASVRAHYGAPPSLGHRLIANHPALYRRWLGLGSELLTAGVLPADVRELVILRVALNTRCDYEWRSHWGAAVASGLAPAFLEGWRAAPAIREPIESRLAAAAALADSLHASSDVDDELWSQLGDLFSAEEILELLLLVGHYTTTAYVLNALRAG